ncbi:MAG TPA: phosphoribosylamine--glycine ligase [Woeseiaceae bacterium]|nr:phosphoribosylamine--glycine ligase [Woeseiaceae bacterium]
MKVLVVGGGGREHALAWKCAQSSKVTEVLVAPGNAGTALEPRLRNIAVRADDIDELLVVAQSEAVGLTIIGPEVPLVAGIVDRFRAHGLPCFGPTAKAAQLEGSKSFSKAFLRRHNIPTAAYESFTELEPALAYIRAEGAPVVIKADGLAAGKGVVVASTVEEAAQAASQMLGGAFDDAGRRIVIEEFLEGEEASFIVITDGTNVLPLATSQDHKARDDGDAGPNTGGMGAYSPAPIVTPELERRIMEEIIFPTLSGLRADGLDYLGFLYAGIMVASDGSPRVLEFNCRLGDPETQPIMTRLHSDLVEICEATLAGELEGVSAEWDVRVALGVVMSAGGYPGAYRKGDTISGLPDTRTGAVKVFHAGTSLKGNSVVTDGGRVLCVVGLGSTVAEAQETAYRQVRRIHWADAYYRTDIGYKALATDAQH